MLKSYNIRPVLNIRIRSDSTRLGTFVVVCHTLKWSSHADEFNFNRLVFLSYTEKISTSSSRDELIVCEVGLRQTNDWIVSWKYYILPIRFPTSGPYCLIFVLESYYETVCIRQSPFLVMVLVSEEVAVFQYRSTGESAPYFDVAFHQDCVNICELFAYCCSECIEARFRKRELFFCVFEVHAAYLVKTSFESHPCLWYVISVYISS